MMCYRSYVQSDAIDKLMQRVMSDDALKRHNQGIVPSTDGQCTSIVID